MAGARVALVARMMRVGEGQEMPIPTCDLVSLRNRGKSKLFHDFPIVSTHSFTLGGEIR